MKELRVPDPAIAAGMRAARTWLRHMIMALGIALLVACGEGPIAGCLVRGEKDNAPASLDQIQLRMSLAALKVVLGEPDYSPVEGQYVFYTGPGCKPDRTDPTSHCGFIAEFRRPSVSGGLEVTDALQSCSWGVIGE